jgi:predicted secreted Zn-dependent protease
MRRGRGGAQAGCAAALLLGAACQGTHRPPAAPEPPPEALLISGAQVLRYPLEGRDLRELAMSCALRCPTLDGQRKSHGLTDWTLRWTWQQVPSAEGCAVVDVQKEQRVEVWLPRWDPPPGADRSLVRRWPAYLADLAAHERAHVALVLAAAESSEERLRAAGCDQAEELSRRWIEELEAAHHHLDLQTGHGPRLRGP